MNKKSIIQFWYNFLIYLSLPLAIPFFVYNIIFNKEEWRQRLGFFRKSKFNFPQKPIWIHAASMGEVVGVIPIIKKLKKSHPEYPIVLSTMTITGNQKAKNTLSDIVDKIFIIPLDINFCVKKAFSIIDPELLIIAETELWPNLIFNCDRHKIPIMIVNGRISDTSLPTYQKIKGITKSILRTINFICAKSQLDRRRFIALGYAPKKIKNCGNCKFEIPLPDHSSSETHKKNLRNQFKLPADKFIIVAGSTRPGEEKILIETYKKLKSRHYPNIILALAPRHLHRLKEVEDIISKYGISYQKKSTIQTTFNQEIYLLDTMGELSQLYGTADIAFVGGTLMPFGGHNPLEPAIYGIPVIFGPFIQNARDSYHALLDAHGAIQVNNENIFEILLKYIKTEDELKKIGKNAKSVLLENRGASDKILMEIENLL